ncbi:LINE-1 retrotransposable element ORF2 protein [Cucumis melo var. makuwa]|uniref:LINE-1 retrotransposable element ORF2 protein n=1 Tax=Cucumis melo var. makuwa TaxID=1194695 RepID=A0A5D3C9J6_CUCMM|nr:LINE-1 retrotransposable element ORF2 protein [Cucumis melo var. makuwa]TYK08531.1 LINE-1 retrotransposable element ORF2 protein [Cucumis melo var. makuwa]
MDYLSRLLSHLESTGAIKGVCLANDCNISHILFADDILLFVEDNDLYLKNLRMAISLFEKASGLKINLSKSVMVPVNVPWPRALECASSWEISCHTLPLTYLGVPLGGNPKSKLFWRNIEDRIQKKLSNWKYAHISKGGRLTLIKSTLSSLPIYQLSVFQAPSSTYKNIEKLWRNFLWKGSCGSKGSHLINWAIVTKPKEEGELGISKLQITNQALLSKWLWRYYSEPNSLWRRLIHIKYQGKHPGDIPSNISSSSPKAPWRSIINNIDWFKRNQGWDLNNGDQISFWFSNWSPEGNLPVPRTNRGPSKPTWIPDSKKSFFIASAKSCIYHQPELSIANPRVKLLDLIWKSFIPMKIKFFLWCLVQRKLNTMEVIQQRMPNSLLQPNWCVLCKKDSETGAHLFFHCDLVKHLWSLLQRSLNFAPFSDDFEALFSFFLSLNQSLPKHKVVFCGLIAVLWGIWAERNNRIFDTLSYQKSINNLWEDYKILIGNWCSRDPTFKNYSATTIALNLNALCN